ncbi:protein CHROMATIN REMODELING 24 isoform X2 [Alnus glutinosa]|uniref:protein CHROMATIN REMODELING 24 isoform X2 n=1 Tax=Alnus glutinosa TaxID=3517 RepID=UPI002D774A5D|nr:protein CHROMATIN REMODELING 24 isoform X2 [Alnus glutinosa]
MKSSKKPLSLNDRHYRLLQDLSAPPKPSSRPSADDNDIPQFSGIGDFDSPLGEGKPSKVNNNDRDDENISQFSGITSLDSPLEKEKPTKVKIEGRRRLCKVSTRHNDSSDDTVVLDDPTFSDITEFDSPPPENAGEGGGENRGGSEIRDILNDLSAKFDFLSIEKKRVPKRIDLVEDSLDLVGEKEMSEEKKVDFPEYVSAGSSLSLASDMSGSSSDVVNSAGGGVENAVEEHEEKSDLWNVSEGNRAHGVKNNSGRLNRNEPREVGEKLMSRRLPFVTETAEETVFDSKEDGFVGGVHGTKKHGGAKTNDPQPQRMDTKLVPVHQFFESKVEEREDDCVTLSGKKMVKVVEKWGKKLKEEYNDSDGDDVLDDYADGSVLEDDGSITFSGSKSTYKLPGKIAKMLYPHQRDGLRWLWSLHCQGKGGILGDDMGLGKTMQICGFLAGLFHSRLIKRAMIVAPKTLMPHWIKELSAVGLSEKIREYYGTCPKARQYELQYILQDKGVLLTTYDIVRNNSKSLRGDYYFDDEGSEDSVTWDYMILDEGHLIKNPSTQRAKSLLEIPSACRIIISGTPLQNNLKELWALFNFCCPDLLGDKQWFKEKFEYAILRGNEKKASDREKRIGSTVAKELRERIQPYFLRRLKSEVFSEDNSKSAVKLSKKNEVIVWLRLTSCQRQLYEAFLKSELVLSAFDGSPLAALTILKKICDHPLLLTKRAAEDVLEGMESMFKPEDVKMAEKLAMHIADVAETDDLEESHDNVSCKLSFIMSLLDNLISEGHSVLIFSQTRKMLNLIQDSIVSKAYEFLRIDGTTKASDRVKIVSDFQEGVGAPIFLLTSQVGGLGLTLTRADRVIVVDPAWNPSTDNQSVDRAYRIGQKKDVIVYRLMTCGTVEEKIYRKQIFKGGLFRTATEHKEQIRYFSQQDLRELFSLPEQGFDVSVTQQQLHEEHDCQHIMDSYLKADIEFLETQGIAGVSHHSLLYSKTAPVQVVNEEEEEVIRKKGPTFVGYSSSSSSVEHTVDGAVHAFKPKDLSLNKKSSSLGSEYKLTELGLEENISRLSQTLANKGMVARLPDKGEKLVKQIAELKSELYKIRKAERAENQVIDLDSLSGDLQRVLNV